MSTGRSFHRSAALPIFAIACAALLAGCKGSGSARDMQGAETADDIARQIERSTALVRQAQRHELAGQETLAIETYRRAITEYRELPVAWNNLGALLQKKGDNLAAAEAFQTASEFSPTDPRPVHNLGTLWESLGYNEDAAKWYTTALARDPQYLPSLRRMVVIDEIRNKPDAQTLERIRTALLLEKDEFWIEKMRRASMRFEQRIRDAQSDAMSAGQ